MTGNQRIISVTETSEIDNEEAPKIELQKLGTDHNFKRKIVWPNVIAFAIIHLLGVYGLYLMLSGKVHILTSFWGIFFGVIVGFGITMGAHRLFSHKAFKATPPLKIFLLILQTISGQNSMYIWVRDHRQHHKYSDTDADPHNAQRGLFFSHIGWLMSKKHPLVIEKGKTIDMSDLENDKFVMFQKKYYYLLYFPLAVILPTLVPMYFWKETFWKSLMVDFFARYVLQLNFTWLVNSFAHFNGNKPFDKYISPAENVVVGFLAMGEGWHNYHHCFPWDYRASEIGSPFNITRRFIDLCASLGLAYDLKTASPSLIASRCNRTGDGSHPVFGKTKDIDKDE